MFVAVQFHGGQLPRLPLGYTPLQTRHHASFTHLYTVVCSQHKRCVYACMWARSENVSESSTREMGLSQADISYHNNISAHSTTYLQGLTSTMHDEFDSSVTNLCSDANNRYARGGLKYESLEMWTCLRKCFEHVFVLKQRNKTSKNFSALLFSAFIQLFLFYSNKHIRPIVICISVTFSYYNIRF